MEDAAKRLTLTLSEDVNVYDVLQLAIEGHLKLSWNMRHVAAIQVKYTKKIIPVMLELFPEQKEPFVSIGFHAVEGQDSVVMLSGAHNVLLEHCGALSDYLLAQITNTGGELISLDGYYVQDSEGVKWKIMERFENSLLKELNSENKRKLYDTANYVSSGVWPEISELGFIKNDLEMLENSLLSKESEKPVLVRERTGYLNIIGALLGVLLGKSSSGIAYSQFESQQAVIDCIHATYGDRSGLSKRNLEDKFAKAKEKL